MLDVVHYIYVAGQESCIIKYVAVEGFKWFRKPRERQTIGELRIRCKNAW